MRNRARTLEPLLVRSFGVTIIVAAGLLWGGNHAFAQTNGPTDEGAYCMQTLYGTPVTSSNQINCTAGDVRISRATEVDPTSCILGETFDLEATFEIDVTSDERYRPAFFFRTDGGPSARGEDPDTGTCSLSRLDPTIAPAEQLNNSTDTCGDLNSGVYEVTFVIEDVLCSDTDGDGFLNLPNCTSWGNNKNEVCNIEDEFDFAPYNKSKCVCDDDFQVPVIVETATITTTKTGSPGSVNETGGVVSMTAKVQNDATYVDVTIDSVTDTVGTTQVDLTTITACSSGEPSASVPYCTPTSMTSCASLIGHVLGPGESTMCYFDVWLEGDADSSVTDTVEYCGQDSAGHSNICDDDDETTEFDDVSSAPTVDKSVDAEECTVDVTYKVVVTNTSAIDTLTINSSGLTDDKFGDITTPHTANGFEQVVSTKCGVAAASGGAGALPHDIAPLGNYTCTFVGRIASGNCDFSHTDTVTADVTDDDGVNSTPSNSATISVMTSCPE